MVEIDQKMKAPLSILAANGGRISGKTKFQKLVFLAEQEEGMTDFYEFEKHNYGPYSFDLTDDLNVLKRLNLIEVTVRRFSADGPFQGKAYRYSLTDEGKEVLEQVEESIKNSAEQVTEKWGSKSLDPILTYVYDEYMDD